MREPDGSKPDGSKPDGSKPDGSKPDSSKALSRRRFGRFAQGYVTSRTHARGADLERLIEVVAPRPHWRALDVATGGGHTALRLAPRVARVVATDLTPEMLETARTFVASQGARNVEFRPADAEDLPFEAAAFDLVTCRIAAHHFPRPERFVAEAARVLKSGGIFWLQDQVLPEDPRVARYVDGFEKLRDPSHHRAFPESAWRAMISGVGLRVEHAEQLVKRHELRRWAERQRCTRKVIARLETLLAAAPRAAAEWMQPRDPGTPAASFVNHHVLISARRG